MVKKLREDYLQYKLCEWLREKDILHFHVPNGGLRTKAQASQFVAMGVRKGVHDLIILLDGGITLFVELKVKGNYQSKEQKNFSEDIKKLGFQSHLLVADTIEDGLLQLQKILHTNGLQF